MTSKKVWIISLFLILFCCCGFFIFLFSSFFSESETSFHWGADAVALVKVEGAIFSSDEAIELLEKVRKEDRYKVLVLRVDSPGGAVGPSQEIYQEVKKVVQKKPVIVSMGSLAASGGYYISAPATKIVANEGTITGSIGVLMEHVELDELLSFLKLHAEVLKAGKMKDVGSQLRKMTPEERDYLQSILYNMHEQFLKAVSEGRKIPIEEMRKIGDGRVFTGEQALGVKLVDQLGNLQDAIDLAAQTVGIKGEPKVIKVEKKKPGFLDVLSGDEKLENRLSAWFATARISKAYFLMKSF